MFFKCLEGDATRFLQVLVNFLNNSLKFSSKNSEIRVNLVVIEKHLTFEQNYKSEHSYGDVNCVEVHED